MGEDDLLKYLYKTIKVTKKEIETYHKNRLGKSRRQRMDDTIKNDDFGFYSISYDETIDLVAKAMRASGDSVEAGVVALLAFHNTVGEQEFIDDDTDVYSYDSIAVSDVDTSKVVHKASFPKQSDEYAEHVILLNRLKDKMVACNGAIRRLESQKHHAEVYIERFEGEQATLFFDIEICYFRVKLEKITTSSNPGAKDLIEIKRLVEKFNNTSQHLTQKIKQLKEMRDNDRQTNPDIEEEYIPGQMPVNSLVAEYEAQKQRIDECLSIAAPHQSLWGVLDTEPTPGSPSM